MRRLVLVPVLTFAFACADSAAPPTAIETPDVGPLFSVNGNSGPSINGHTNLSIAGALQTVSFHARENPDGSTTGILEAFSRGQGIQAHGKATCLNVEGNEAWVIYEITNSKLGPLQVGDGNFFAVRDNGEGDVPDEWTDIFGIPADFDCKAYTPAEIWALLDAVNNEGGNIQVRP
jgi:hypothetical protein